MQAAKYPPPFFCSFLHLFWGGPGLVGAPLLYNIHKRGALMIFLKRRVLPVLLVCFLLFSQFSPAYSIAIADDMVFVLAFLSLIGMSSAYLAGHAGDSAYWEMMAESIVQSIDDARSDLLTAGNVIWGDENGDGNADADDLPTGAAVKALLSSPGQVAVGKNIMLVSYPAFRSVISSISEFKDKAISFADDALQTIIDYYFPADKIDVNSFSMPITSLSGGKHKFYTGGFQGWYDNDLLSNSEYYNMLVDPRIAVAYIYWSYEGNDYMLALRSRDIEYNLDYRDFVNGKLSNVWTADTYSLTVDPSSFLSFLTFDRSCHFWEFSSARSTSTSMSSGDPMSEFFWSESLFDHCDPVNTAFTVYVNPVVDIGLSADDVGVGYFPDSVTDTQYKVPAIDKPLSIPTVGALEGVLSNPAFSQEDALELAGTINPNIGLEGEGGGEVVVPPADDDFSPWLLPDSLKERFPFSVPFDLIAAFRTLASADRNAPHFEYRLYSAKFGIDYTFVVDLSDFDSAAQIFRTMELLLFIVGLILISRNMIRG